MNIVEFKRIINSNIEEKKDEDSPSSFYNLNDIKFEKYYITH